MRLYAQISGGFFSVLAAVQLTRTVLGWPVEVADIAIPVWVSGLAFVIAATFAIWAFRTAKGAA
jgi:hypothetical protein